MLNIILDITTIANLFMAWVNWNKHPRTAGICLGVGTMCVIFDVLPLLIK